MVNGIKTPIFFSSLCCACLGALLAGCESPVKDSSHASTEADPAAPEQVVAAKPKFEIEFLSWNLESEGLSLIHI